jgi:hypothetical protein
MKTMPSRPRQNTSSAALNQAEAIFTHTAMEAKPNDASHHPEGLHQAPGAVGCIRAAGRVERGHGLAVPLVEVLHAVFHRALVRADLVVAALHQGLAAGVHAQGDLVVLDAGLHVGGLLRLDELALERAISSG